MQLIYWYEFDWRHRFYQTVYYLGYKENSYHVCSTCYVSGICIPYNNCMILIPLLSLLYQWGNSELKKWSDLLKVTHPRTIELGLEASQTSKPTPYLLQYYWAIILFLPSHPQQPIPSVPWTAQYKASFSSFCPKFTWNHRNHMKNGVWPPPIYGSQTSRSLMIHHQVL